MLRPIAIIADDLTGAADTAAALARPGRPVPVSLSLRPCRFRERGAFAVTTESRAFSPEEAGALAEQAARAALEVGPGLVYKKVDSNLRGNLGSELKAVAKVVGHPVLLAPAFPVRGRTTVAGVGLLHGQPIAETEMRRDPQAPVAESRVAALVRGQAHDLAVGECPLSAVRESSDAITKWLGACDVLVADAETDDDLGMIARAGVALSPPPVLAGSAGLARALAMELSGPPEARAAAPEPARPVLAVLASSSERLLDQVDAAASAGMSPVALSCRDLSWEEEEVPELAEAIGRAGAEMDAGRDAVVYAAGPLPPAERPVDLVVEHLAHLAFVLVQQFKPVGLVLGGGATARGVLSVLGVEALEVEEEPLPGTAGAVAVGGHIANLPLALKPGAAGDDDAVVELLRCVGRRAAAKEADG